MTLIGIAHFDFTHGDVQEFKAPAREPRVEA